MVSFFGIALICAGLMLIVFTILIFGEDDQWPGY